jgi:HPt (histidine-containing phosphotransfer) domain-containing protein
MQTSNLETQAPDAEVVEGTWAAPVAGMDSLSAPVVSRQQRRHAARQLEKKLRKDNSFDRIQTLFDNCAQRLLLTAPFATAFSKSVISENLNEAEQSSAVALLGTLESDVRELSAQLTTIQVRHAGRSGGISQDTTQTAADSELLLACISDYNEWEQRMTRVLTPTTNQLVALARAAEERSTASKEQA